MHPVRLSERAWSIVESRRGDMLHDDYVSMLIENMADLSADGSLMPEGIRLIEVVEAHQPTYGPHEDPGGDVAKHVIDYLREAYRGKVPRDVFVRKCIERGLNDDEILQAVHDYFQWLA